MRERAGMHDGTLDAHPGPDGGYVVRAWIPLDRPAYAPPCADRRS
jgi:hypothetical protein